MKRWRVEIVSRKRWSLFCRFKHALPLAWLDLSRSLSLNRKVNSLSAFQAFLIQSETHPFGMNLRLCFQRPKPSTCASKRKFAVSSLAIYSFVLQAAPSLIWQDSISLPLSSMPALVVNACPTGLAASLVLAFIRKWTQQRRFGIFLRLNHRRFVCFQVFSSLLGNVFAATQCYSCFKCPEPFDPIAVSGQALNSGCCGQDL